MFITTGATPVKYPKEPKEITLRHVKAHAALIGAKVEDDRSGQTHECRIEAPKGKVWKSDFIHEMIDCSNRPWKPDYADLMNRMHYGIEDCTDPDCDWCHPEEDI
jgi:hypothetical protein